MPVGLSEEIPAGGHDSARCDDGFSIGTMIETLRTATQLARSLRSDFKFGICGEHGRSPQSIPFLHDLKLDYVSCLPFRVPVVWMNANPRTRPAKRDQRPLIFIGGSMSVAMVRFHR